MGGFRRIFSSKSIQKAVVSTSPKPFIAMLGVAEDNRIVKSALRRRWR